MEIVAEMRDANPKLTERVMVQFPTSQTQPLMKERRTLEDLAIWKDQ
jgi:hypothetical protein